MNRRDLLRLTTLMLSGVASGSISQAVLAAQPIHSGLSKLIFNENQALTISVLSEMIIPKTETPGAIEAGVPDFIATIVSQWYNDREREIFFTGLANLDVICRDRAGCSFIDAKESIRVDILKEKEQLNKQYLREKSAKATLSLLQKDDSDLPFFGKLKELVVLGYYTSEVGAKQELSYLPMPGYYDGDYNYHNVGRRWTS